MINFRIEPVNLDEVARGLSGIPGAIQKVTKRAIAKTLRFAKKDAKILSKRRYTLPPSIVSKSLTLSNFGMSGELSSWGSRNPLEKAKVNPKKRITKRGKYIRAEVVRGQGDIIKKAFWSPTIGSGIYERLTENKFPLKRLKTVSAPQMLSHPSISTPIQNNIRENLSEIILAEAARVLGG